jgi:hypothetical protein
VGGSPPGIQQIYRLDRLTGGLERVSVTGEGRAAGEEQTYVLIATPRTGRASRRSRSCRPAASIRCWAGARH